MRLPPVDIYRRPFVVPLGHLTLFSAQVELLLADCIAFITAGSDRNSTVPHFENAADRVRNWVPDKALVGLENLTALESHHQISFFDCLRRFGELRLKRNRYIHDAVEVGWDDVDGSQPLHVGYEKVAKKTRYSVRPVTPEAIAELAVEYSELRADLDILLYIMVRQWHPDE